MANAIDWTIFFGYLGIIFAVGLWFARQQETNEDYFVGDRKMNWLAVGISLFATAFSSISFVAYPREAAYETFQFFIAILFIPLVITPILWWWFVPLYVRLGVISIYEYLEIRFHPVLRKLGTLLFAGYAIGWMGSMLYAVGLILQVVLGLSDAGLMWTLVGTGLFATFYTAIGGVKAVIWTDVLQTVVLGGGTIVVFLLALGQIDGGWEAVLAIGQAHNKFEMFNFAPELQSRGTFYAACAFGLFMYLPGYTASQVTGQRYVCMSSLAEARRALLLHALVVTFVVLMFFVLGVTLFAYYSQHDGLPVLERQDQIMPLFVVNVLHGIGLVGLLVAGLFAAAMSTIDSGINSLTAVVVCDWLAGRKPGVGFSRMLCALFGVAIVAASLLAPYLGENVIGIITTVASTFLGLLLGIYLLGMFVRRANTGGAVLGLLAGISCFGTVLTMTDVPNWWYGLFTILPTFAVGWMASYLFPAPRSEQLRGLAYCQTSSLDVSG